MTLWTSKMCIRANGLPFFTTTPQDMQRRKRPTRSRQNTHLLHVSVILVCLASSIIPQCHGFFFPKSFFRKGNDSPPPPLQQHPRVISGGQGNYGGEHLQGSGTDVQPALRIVNRPHPPPRNNDQQQQPSGPVPGSGFHVPKELCLACERFPWMPVAGSDRPSVGAASTSVVHSQQPQQHQQQHQAFISPTGQGSSPTKTIVINALGEAQGPVPQLPQLPSRRPFAIQFDANQSGNKVNYPDAPRQAPQSPPSQPISVVQQNNFSQAKPERPVSFQIFQAQTPNHQATVLQQTSHPIGLQPPPISQQSGQQSGYGRPTVLLPAQSTQVRHNINVQSNHISAPPPNPMAVGTIIATQQNNAQLAQFQKIEPAKLVYQEHFTAQASASPPAPQNFKVPIIPHPTPNQEGQTPHENVANNNIIPPQFPPQQNFGPPPQDNYRPGGIFLQMRPPAPYGMQPPRPSPNMKPPGPMIHYGKPIRIPNNIGPQRPSGQVLFPPPQAFLQMGPPPPPPQGQFQNGGYGVPRPEQANALDSSVRPQEERRPSPSGQVLNIQLPQQQQTNRPPLQGQVLNSNSIQPVPIPIPTTINNHHESGSNGIDNGRPNKQEPTFTQETGWEIIPSIQTDLTHLFSSEKGKPSPQGAKELPVPVPIPVPQTHPPKSPFFIVAGAGQQQQQQQHQEQQIKVQDVTYHEESRNPVPSVSAPLNTLGDGGRGQNNDQQQQEQHQQQNFVHTNSLAQNENQQTVEQEQRPQVQTIQQQQIMRPRPFILGVPTGPTRPVIFRPLSPQQQPFQQLHPSIMTALNHAQQTSLLTHQYFRQPNVGQALRENTIYVRPVAATGPVASAQQVQQLQKNNVLLSESASNPVQQETIEANNLEQQRVNHGIDPRIPTTDTSAGSVDPTNPNCQGKQQQQPWLIPITAHQKQQQQAAEDIVHQQQNPETGHAATSVDQSISSPSDGFTSADDDQSESYRESGRDNVNEDDASSSPDSLAPEPTYATSLASVPPTAATNTVTNFGSLTSSSPGIRGSISVQDNGNKGSYLIYYPRPVSKSPVYWVQPSRTTSQGVVRLSPQITPVSSSVASTLVTWSRPRVVVANQFRTEHQPEQQQQQRYEDPKTQEARSQESYERGEETEGSEEQAQSGQVSSEQHNDDDNENIPFGQKLGVSRDSNKIQTPYDIISVGGSDDEAQSLEETSVPGDHSQGLDSKEQAGKDHYGESDFTSSGQDGSTGIGNDHTDLHSGPSVEYPKEGQEQQQLLQNENNLQSVQQETKNSYQDENEDADDERDDFGFRPQTIFRKPISTTVIHSPGASSFQSLKLPNFKPHRVIVHDFTAHSANAAATGPSASASEPQESIETKDQKLSSEAVQSAWMPSQRLKSPKLVENSDDEEESSESINRPQGFNIQEVIASGPVSTADCLTTAHSGHLLTSLSSTSPRTAESLGTAATSAKGRDIFFPLGSRFPGGRPSIFSAIHRPLSSQIALSTSRTTPSTTTESTNEKEQVAFNPVSNVRERYVGQSPSGFAASIPVPVYRRPIHISRDTLEENNVGGVNNIHGDGVTYIKPQANIILSAEDIYKTSEMKEERVADNLNNNDASRAMESSTSVSSSVDTTTDSMDEIMSTEKSSSFSVSVVDDKRGGFSNNKDEQPSHGSLGKSEILQQVGTKPLSKVNVVQITSVPVITDAEPITPASSTLTPSSSSADSLITTTTAIPSPASTSTKIVKTVRVRQRMRSGSFNGPLRTRFHGGGRVRVVHRPANQEYIRHFPEFATQEGDKLAKEEEQEVKNALIELKKSTEPVKTHKTP